MRGTTSQVFAIQTVRTIQPSNGAVVVAFGSGLVGRFPLDHPDWESMLREAQSSLAEGKPVGVQVDGDGLLLELSHAHEPGVYSIREDEEDNCRLAIWFWG
jgi:hypothetical protein